MNKRIISFLVLLAMLFAINVRAMTLYEYYKGNLPTISERAKIALSAGINGYMGTYSQNIKLLDWLLSGGQKLGSNVPSSGINWTLSAPITSSASTITLSTVTDIRSNVITQADLPTKVYLIIEPNNTSNTEIIVCPSSGYSSANKQFTSCTRGLAFSGISEAAVTANQKAHAAGSLVIMSNPGQFFNNFVWIDGNQSIDGIKTFTTAPIIPDAGVSATTSAASIGYVNDVGSSGASNGSETVKGIWEGATQSEMSIGTNLGATGAGLLLQNKYATSTPSATTTIPITGSDGKLDQSFLDLTGEAWQFVSISTTGSMAAGGNFQALGSANTMATTTFSVTPIIPTATSTLAGQVIGLDANGKIPSMTDGSLIITPVSTTTQVIASDVLKISADTASSTAALSFAKSKEVLVRRAGTYRIKFDLQDVNVVTHGKIYKNGAGYGTDRDTAGGNSGTWTTYSEDKVFAIGDLIQIYFYTTNASFPAQLRNFRIYYSYEEPLPDYNINIP